MHELWTPKHIPPQATPGAVAKVTQQLTGRGLRNVYAEGVTLFQMKQSPLRDFIKEIVVEREGRPIDDTRPLGALRIGAVMTHLTYLESGFEETIDDGVINLSILDAELEGVPKAYLLALPEDQGLQRVVEVVNALPEMQDGAEEGAYDQLVELGAGCVRYFLAHYNMAA